jgi:hypothetical protein
MPIFVRDPWRLQYFEGTACPPDVRIPIDDIDAWAWFPAHSWIYDRLAVARSQGLPAGPHGSDPGVFPVFSKPIINLKGRGGQQTLDYENLQSTLLTVLTMFIQLLYRSRLRLSLGWFYELGRTDRLDFKGCHGTWITNCDLHDSIQRENGSKSDGFANCVEPVQ